MGTNGSAPGSTRGGAYGASAGPPMGFPMALLRVLTRSTSSAAAGFAGSSGPEARGFSSSSLFRRPDMSSTRWRRLSTTRCCFSRASSRFSRYRSRSARSSSMSFSAPDWSSRIPGTSVSRLSFALSRLSRRCTMASIPIFEYLPMRKDTFSQWHAACFPPDPAHPAVPYGVLLRSRVPGHRCRPGPGWPLQAPGVVLQAGFWGRVSPCGRSGRFLRLRRWLIGCPIALGVPLGFPQPDRARVRIHSPGVPCRGLG